MDKRFALALGLSVAIIFGWNYFFPPVRPVPPAPATTRTSSDAAPVVPGSVPTPAPALTATAPAAGSAPVPSGALPANGAAPVAPIPPVEKPKEQLVTFEEPGFYRATLSSYGGAIVSWELLSPHYVSGKGKDTKPIQLAEKYGTSSMLTISATGDLPVPADAVWSEAAAAPDQKRFVYDSDTVKVTKTYSFVPKTYEVKLHVRIESKLDRATKQAMLVDVPGYHNPGDKGGGFFSPSVIVTEGACHVDGKLEHSPYDKILKEPIAKSGHLRWAAIDRKFFVAAVAFSGANTDGAGHCSVAANGAGQMLAQLVLPERTLAGKGTTELELGGFFGPKLVKELDRIRIGAAQVDVKLGDVMNYGMTEFIARPLLAVLRAAHSVIPNWGIAVILLTILVKAALWWPTQKSMESMKKVGALKPEVDKLKERHGDDKNAFNMAVMELYRKEGVNPAGGCLPMLIQFPIFIGLFSMLGSSVELYHAPFVPGWIVDLTQPDPFYILPVALGGLMYLQQKLSPTAPDANQKTMMYGMQIAFVVASLLWPAGLTLYSLTNSVTSIFQQWITNRKIAAAPVVASSNKNSKKNKKS